MKLSVLSSVLVAAALAQATPAFAFDPNQAASNPDVERGGGGGHGGGGGGHEGGGNNGPRPQPSGPRPQPSRPEPSRPNNPPPHDNGGPRNNGGDRGNGGNRGNNGPHDGNRNNGGNPGNGPHDGDRNNGGNRNNGPHGGDRNNGGDRGNRGDRGDRGGVYFPPTYPSYPSTPIPYDPSGDDNSTVDQSPSYDATVAFEDISRTVGGEGLRITFDQPTYVDYVEVSLDQAGLQIHDAYLVTESGRHVAINEFITAGILQAPAQITSDYVTAGERIVAIEMQAESMGGSATIEVTVISSSETPSISASKF